ncbi:hypothetical protein CRUP_014643, partial [Coryphaenoides rupestris]
MMDEEPPDPISLGVCGVGQPPPSLKRKAETPLGSPPEPGQILQLQQQQQQQQQQDEDSSGRRYKIRHHLTLLDRPSTPGKEPPGLEQALLSMPATPVPAFAKETSATANASSAAAMAGASSSSS